MGKSMSTAKNVSRSSIAKVATESVIHSKPKPNQEAVQRATAPDADYLKKLNHVDQSFNDRLKQVFVQSVNNNPNFDLPIEHPLMPKDRSSPWRLKPHSQTVEVRKPNTLLVDDVRIILINYQTDPETWTFEYIAEKFDISKENAEKLVSNYSTLDMFFAKAPEGNNEPLPKNESVQKITPNTTLDELEDIMTQGRRKWKTKEEMSDEWRGSSKK